MNTYSLRQTWAGWQQSLILLPYEFMAQVSHPQFQVWPQHYSSYREIQEAVTSAASGLAHTSHNLMQTNKEALKIMSY